MMRSLYSGVSGLRNHQTRMDVIGNNISNVNTAGFKASRVVFQDIYSQTASYASAADPAGRFGGVNPMQIGLGVTLASIDVMHTSAATMRTDNPSDLSISGDGFFVVQNSKGQMVYTRAGNFSLDAAGNLVTVGGDYVMGVDSQSYIVRKEKLDDDGIVETVGGVLSTLDEETGLYSPVDYYEDLRTYNALEAELASGLNADGEETEIDREYITGWLADRPYLNADCTFNSDDYEIREGPNPFTAYKMPAGRTWDDAADVLEVDADDAAGETEFYLMNSAVINIDTDLAEFNPNSLKKINLQGYTGIVIDGSGIVKGIDPETNEKVVLFTIALANFTNPAGLEKAGNSQYEVSSNSGSAVYSQAKTLGAGEIDPGGLEMSNVDLANEFTDMIVTQRGFQANSRIITVSDSMLEELINLKR